MNMTATIVSIIAVLGSLILVSRNSALRDAGGGKMLRYAVIWAAIIVGLFVLIQVSGFRISQ